MVIVLEILLAVVVVAVSLWAWRMSGLGRPGLLLTALVLSVFFWPWVRDADWWQVAEAVAVAVPVCAAVGLYSWLIARARAAARERDGQ